MSGGGGGNEGGPGGGGGPVGVKADFLSLSLLLLLP